MLPTVAPQDADQEAPRASVRRGRPRRARPAPSRAAGDLDSAQIRGPSAISTPSARRMAAAARGGRGRGDAGSVALHRGHPLPDRESRLPRGLLPHWAQLFTVETAGPGHEAAVLAIAERTEPPAAATLLHEWWDETPSPSPWSSTATATWSASTSCSIPPVFDRGLFARSFDRRMGPPPARAPRGPRRARPVPAPLAGRGRRRGPVTRSRPPAGSTSNAHTWPCDPTCGVCTRRSATSPSSPRS